jgi:hypothetical protein
MEPLLERLDPSCAESILAERRSHGAELLMGISIRAPGREKAQHAGSASHEFTCGEKVATAQER